MAFPAVSYITPDDYLEIEVRSLEKHEYFEGRIYDMAGSEFDHNFIVTDLIERMNIHLGGKRCKIFTSDLRVTTPNFDSFMYPDVTILCEKPEKKENRNDILTNPTAIVEVMSPSTKGYDLSFKFHFYKQIPTLREYILIDSTRFFVQINRRKDANTWEEPINIELVDSKFDIRTIGLELALKEIYSNVSFYQGDGEPFNYGF